MKNLITICVDCCIRVIAPIFMFIIIIVLKLLLMPALLKRGVTGTPIVKVFMYTHGIYNTLGEYCSTWGVVEHHKCHFTPQ